MPFSGKKFIEGFKLQTVNMPVKRVVNENHFIASDEGKYTSLTIVKEFFGQNHVIFAEVVFAVGDYEAAIADGSLLEPENSSLVASADESLFYFQPMITEEKISSDSLTKLNAFSSLNSKIYHSPNFTILKQRGTHDLILKDPLCVQMVRNRLGLEKIFAQLNELKVDYGLYVQKPKGLANKKNVKWQTIVNRTASVLFVIAMLLIMLLRK